MNPKFMKEAIAEAKKGLEKIGHGPFGACVVKGDEIISVAHNTVTKDCDPTAHAEVSAIRKACKKLKTFELKGCEIYSTCEPCFMCFGTIYWARVEKVYYGCTRVEAAKYKFDDQYIYDELGKDPGERRLIAVPKVLFDDCLEIFRMWEVKEDKIRY